MKERQHPQITVPLCNYNREAKNSITLSITSKITYVWMKPTLCSYMSPSNANSTNYINEIKMHSHPLREMQKL